MKTTLNNIKPHFGGVFISNYISYIYKKYLIMAKKYKVLYTLVYTGGGKSTYGTTILMESDSFSEAERKIRETNNINSNVEDIQINRVILE
jgi:hypothetical protein